jgi:hypothetical protein
MILNAIIDVLVSLFAWGIDKLPTADSRVLSIGVDWLYNIKVYMLWANWFFPVDTMFLMIDLWIVIIKGLILFLVIRWLLSILTHDFIH